MSEADGFDLDAARLTFDCPFCHAPAGEWCKTVRDRTATREDGKRAINLHVDRGWLVYDAYLAGYRRAVQLMRRGSA